MLDRLLRRLNRDPLRVRVEHAIRRGTGLRNHEWLLDEWPPQPPMLDALSERIVEWCRGQIADTRRPYGIDQMALAVACAEPGGQPIASTTFGVFRPVDFYREGGIGERLGAFVRGVPVDGDGGEHEERRGPVRFAAALFCWGDVARETIFDDDEAPPSN